MATFFLVMKTVKYFGKEFLGQFLFGIEVHYYIFVTSFTRTLLPILQSFCGYAKFLRQKKLVSVISELPSLCHCDANEV